MGLKGPAYMQYSNMVKDKFSVHHQNFFKLGDKYVRERDAETEKLWREYLSVQYYYNSKFNYDHLIDSKK